jgi:ABC-type polysaccharide/polyol phosphate export permease
MSASHHEALDQSEFREPSTALLNSWNDYHPFLRQVKLLTAANLKARYRKTVAGFIWVVANPIIMYGAQSIVFKLFLRLNIPHYELFLLTGLLPWIFLTQSMDMCTSIFVNSSQLLKSFQVNPLVYLVAQLADNGINFLAAFLILLVPVWIMNPSNAVGLLLLPLSIFSLAAGALGLCWLLATAQVFFRDTRFLVQFATSVGFFLTPIFYSEDFIPPAARVFVLSNPFYRLLLPFRAAIYDFTPMAFLKAIMTSLLTSSVLLGLAYLFWSKKRNAVYFNV